MGSPESDAEPSALFEGVSSGGGGTAVVALWGEFEERPPRDEGRAEANPYSLFYARSASLGWLTEQGHVGHWRMNEAEYRTDLRGPSSMAWFQVELAPPPGGNGFLPIQPLVACADNAVQRLGRFHLETLQVFMPIRPILAPNNDRIGELASLVEGAPWFADVVASRRTPVRVMLSSRDAQGTNISVEELLDWVNHIKQAVFTCSSFSMRHEDKVKVPVDLTVNHWVGIRESFEVTLLGTLVEWSVDALAWLTALLAEGVSRLAIQGSVLVSVTR